MALAHNPQIATDGLVFCADAKNIKCYPGSGTGVTDLVKRTSGALNNGASVTSSGDIQFDGANDYAFWQYSSTDLDGDPRLTVTAILKRTSDISGAGPWGISGDVLRKGINAFTYPGDDNLVSMDLWGDTTIKGDQTYPLNQWCFVAWRKYSADFTLNSVDMYLNQTKLNLSYSRTGTTVCDLDTSSAGKGIVLGRVGSTVDLYYSPVTLGVIQIYNRALTDTEIQDNRLAFASRFGV